MSFVKTILLSSSVFLCVRISVQLLPQRVEIVDCEKKRGRTRYYAYVIEVTRKDKSKYYIFRRYRQFDKMVTRLEERFPIEAGSLRASDRTLPTLPGTASTVDLTQHKDDNGLAVSYYSK